MTKTGDASALRLCFGPDATSRERIMRGENTPAIFRLTEEAVAACRAKRKRKFANLDNFSQIAHLGGWNPRD